MQSENFKIDEINKYNSEFTDIVSMKEKVTPIHQLTFAKFILSGLALLFI